MPAETEAISKIAREVPKILLSIFCLFI